MDNKNHASTVKGLSLALMVVLCGAGIYGCKSGDDSGTTTPPTSPVTSPAGPKSGVAGGPGGPLSTPGKGARGAGGPGGPLGQPLPGVKVDPFAKPGAAGVGALALGGPTKRGWDPFFVTWKQLPPPPDPLASGDVQPIRVASAGYEIPAETEVTVREVPDRRVSGIMSGDGVFAIIEQNGESEVVKPGGTTKDGYRVLAINEDSVKLQKKVGNLNYTQTVQLSDIQTGGQSQFTGRTGGLGQSGFPGGGFQPPGAGRPGFGRTAGGGKGD